MPNFRLSIKKIEVVRESVSPEELGGELLPDASRTDSPPPEKNPVSAPVTFIFFLHNIFNNFV